MLSVATGYSVRYLTDEVAAGRENYYTGATAAGEPPGRWWGAGAQSLGLAGLVDTQDMTAVYERFIDPRDERFREPERWDDAETLGHTGRRYASEEQLYAAALNAEPDAGPERRAELRLDAGKRARQNVAFLDATFSVQKSVTVLHTAFEAQEVNARRTAAQAAAHAAVAPDADTVAKWTRRQAEAETAAASWAAHRTAVEDAIWAGNNAALSYLADHAGYSRVGHHGGAAGRFVDAHEWTVASFFQHDSRDHDPQLHIHNAILNRVQGTDGVWRTVDSRAIHRFRGAAAAVGERTMEEHLSRALGVRFEFRSDGKAREVVGVPQAVMDLFSSRRRAITKKTAEQVVAFREKFGRDPNSLELDRLQRAAMFATRSAKSHEGESVEQRLERWDRQLRAEIAGGLAQVASDVLDHAGQPREPVEQWSPSAVLETALADVQAKKAAWTRGDLTRAISDALPAHLGELSGQQVATVLDTLTDKGLTLAVALDADRPGDEALPDALRVADGRSAYETPGGRLYATPEHVHSERVLAQAAAHGGAPALTSTAVDAVTAGLAETGIELGADQQAAVRGVLCSGAAVESLVGPAGTGKSFVIGVVARAWQDPALWDGHQRRVVGLAASQIATDVLAGEGVAARNITQWMATQRRLGDGRPSGDDPEWQLQSGDLVVVDESGMANTQDLVEIQQRVSLAGAKLLLTGDHKQLAAVGAGGGMALVAQSGASYELAEARRFRQDWEKDATLRLRAGDETVLAEYHKHGRLLDSGTLEQAEASAAEAWLADTLEGKQSLLIVDRNDQADHLSAQLRARLVALGKVAETGVPLGAQGTYAGVGDLVQARRNAWNLAGFEGNRRSPINRERLRVLDTRPDGGMVVAPILGRTDEGEQLGETMVLPGTYVTEYVALGYASTVHGAQGQTVDTSHTVATGTTGADALYVGMTRGRECNTAHVTTRAISTDAPAGTAQDAVHRSPAAVLAGALETADPHHSATVTAAESLLEAESVRTPAELLADAAELATAGRTSRWLDTLTDAGHLTPEDRVRLVAEDGASTLAKVLRRAELAGHDPLQVLTEAVAGRPLTGSRQLTNVIHHRITAGVALDPQGEHYADWTPQVDDPAWQQYLDTLAATADQRREQLSDTTATERPQWAIEAFGQPPEHDAEALAEWKHRVGIVAAHREMTGHTDETTALGPAPKAGQIDAYASWCAAWRALGRPESARDELEMSDGQLRVRVRAYEREKAWGPAYVANDLAGVHQAAAQQRNTATLRHAEAATTADPAVRERLEREAAEASALADVLDVRARELIEADQARADWLVHTAASRAAADRATAELSARGIDKDESEQRVTAAEWLAAHQAATAADDAVREIRDDADFADITERRDLEVTETATVGETEVMVSEPAPVDIREIAATEPAPSGEDLVRVPTAGQTADTIDRAQRALLEIRNRRIAEEQHEIDEARAEQLARWHTADHSTDHTAGYESTLDDTEWVEPVLHAEDLS